MTCNTPPTPTQGRPYPVRGYAGPNAPPSRFRWLVKWLLIVPHVLVLIPLWISFILLTVIAWVTIVITGQYPRWIFNFNLGVLRWNWRLSYYSYGVLGTDQYPPFTLTQAPDYPARLDIDYPTRLHRGHALVKWLLAIPHLLILAILFGGGWLSWQIGTETWAWGGGLVALLVLISAVTLTITGQYPRPLFDIIIGMNRWGLRVAAYIALMTDQYPPFRLDLGGNDPDAPTTPTGPPATLTAPSPT